MAEDPQEVLGISSLNWKKFNFVHIEKTHSFVPYLKKQEPAT